MIPNTNGTYFIHAHFILQFIKKDQDGGILGA